MEKSYVMIKPGFMEYEDLIVKRIEEIGGKVVDRKVMRLTKAALDDHYAHLVDISKYPYIVGYMTSGNVVGFVIEGNDGIVAKIRELVGPRYDPPKKTIRGDFGFGDTTKNVVHSSDSIENAEKEIKRFFVDFKKFGIKDCTFLNEQRLDNC